MCLETVIRLSLKSEAMKPNYDDAQSRLRKVGSMQSLQGCRGLMISIMRII